MKTIRLTLACLALMLMLQSYGFGQLTCENGRCFLKMRPQSVAVPTNPSYYAPPPVTVSVGPSLPIESPVQVVRFVKQEAPSVVVVQKSIVVSRVQRIMLPIQERKVIQYLRQTKPMRALVSRVLSFRFRR